MVDSAMFYLIGTLYPLLARATYPTLGFPQYPGEVAHLATPTTTLKAKAQQDAEAALAEPLDVFHTFFLDGQPFIGGDQPVDRRHPAGRDARVPERDRLRVPGWAEDYMAAMESALGDAYSRAGGRRARLHRVRQVAGVAGWATPIIESRVTSAASSSSPIPSLPPGRRGITR